MDCLHSIDSTRIGTTQASKLVELRGGQIRWRTTPARSWQLLIDDTGCEIGRSRRGGGGRAPLQPGAMRRGEIKLNKVA